MSHTELERDRHSNNAGGAPLSEALREQLAAIVGHEHVLLDERERLFFSSDVYRSGELVAAVVSPGSRQEVAEVVGAAVRAGMSVLPRGGGLSYADGYLSDRADAIVIDMRRLDRIIEINEEDMYVTVEAGCTWAALHAALKQKRLRAPFFGPFSGRYATVGGAVAQNSMFHGCALHGSAADSVLGLEVATAGGSLMSVGSAATVRPAPSPFFRTYGPDLVGLFLADGGALGVKVEITLRIIRAPGAMLCASFGYADHYATCRAMSAIGRESLASECFALDEQTHHLRLRRMELGDGIRATAGVVAGQSSLIAGLRMGLMVAVAGKQFLEGVAQSLHVVVEGRDKSDAQARMAAVRTLTLREGAEISNSIPLVMSSTPFPEPTGMLGPEGERWVPVLGLVPHSSATRLIDAICAFLKRHEAEMKAVGAEWSYLTQLCGTTGFFLEVELYWRDRRPLFHERYLGAAYVSRLKDFADNPLGRALIERLRCGLMDIFGDHGAVHSHIGKMYPYREDKTPASFGLLQAIKSHLDPHGRMNPGALGLP